MPPICFIPFLMSLLLFLSWQNKPFKPSNHQPFQHHSNPIISDSMHTCVWLKISKPHPPHLCHFHLWRGFRDRFRRSLAFLAEPGDGWSNPWRMEIHGIRLPAIRSNPPILLINSPNPKLSSNWVYGLHILNLLFEKRRLTKAMRWCDACIFIHLLASSGYFQISELVVMVIYYEVTS